jgi:hypothetical protein
MGRHPDFGHAYSGELQLAHGISPALARLAGARVKDAVARGAYGEGGVVDASLWATGGASADCGGF